MYQRSVLEIETEHFVPSLWTYFPVQSDSSLTETPLLFYSDVFLPPPPCLALTFPCSFLPNLLSPASTPIHLVWGWMEVDLDRQQLVISVKAHLSKHYHGAHPLQYCIAPKVKGKLVASGNSKQSDHKKPSTVRDELALFNLDLLIYATTIDVFRHLTSLSC